MVIELVYVQGFEPSQQLIILFLLNARSNKPGGNGRKRSSGKATFTNQEIVAIEDANRTVLRTK
jgi:hypothetical protein